MQSNSRDKDIYIDSEIGTLKRVIIHSPDSGLGKVIPSKAREWLFDDIIHLETMRRQEYDYFIKLLLYFLDREKVAGKIAEIDAPHNNRNFYKPSHPDYFNSTKVLDPQKLLSDILEEEWVKSSLVAAVCAIEFKSYALQQSLLKLQPKELANTLISGSLPGNQLIFNPIINFIFTRDVGIVIKDHILLNKPSKLARLREQLLVKYIFYHHPFFAEYRDKIIEIQDSQQYFLLTNKEKNANKLTLEGGDFMIPTPDHLLVGCSERTSAYAVNQIISTLFQKDLVKKITVIQIPKKRLYMHIDTIFTQVKRNIWVIFDAFTRAGIAKKEAEFHQQYLPIQITSEKVVITQFEKGKEDCPRNFAYLEDLLEDISENELHSKEKTRFIYSGGNIFPYGQREQWTDSCNVVALKEGVVIGYDRNTRTAESFEKEGFRIIEVQELLEKFENKELNPDTLENTLILLPSAELSRARGGSRCMTMPLLRESPLNL
ncbi:MAG: arginine deiminase family protein [Bacteroidia bacterium]|nr:arginine deiminase family protein [Bacteroidia bacterium]MDW8157366.1 arginine deiminase family protein [Bacteroidia bacterium]